MTLAKQLGREQSTQDLKKKARRERFKRALSPALGAARSFHNKG